MRIVICGSMTAAKEMQEAQIKLLSLGHDVVLPEFTSAYAQMDSLETMHTESVQNKLKYDLIRGYWDKIKDSDAVLVINRERKGIPGYIGGNSFLEMGFAHVLHKPIYLLNEIPTMGYTDELRAMKPVILYGDLTILV